MGTRILYNKKTIIFRCDKKRKCSNQMCGPDWCEHTTEIEHAVFDGEKIFEPVGGTCFVEQ